MKDDQHRHLLLHPLGAGTLLIKLRERRRFLHRRLPARQRVGQEYPGAFCLVPRSSRGQALGQRRVEVLHGETDLQVRDDERRGHDLKPEHSLGGSLLHLCSCERAQSATLQVLCDAAQHLADVRAGAAAWIEHVDVLSRQPVLYAEVVPERHVHASNHVAHHLGRRVPDSELSAQRRVERLQERLVEVLHRLSLVEPLDERLAVHAIQRVGSPVQHLDEVQRPQSAWVGQLLEQ